MEHEIFFQNPVFQNGINVTVRYGTKWMEKSEIGDTLTIKETGKKDIIAKGLIINKDAFVANQIKDGLLEFEHDPACRNIDGLLEELKRVYPDFINIDIVTVLFFVIRN